MITSFAVRAFGAAAIAVLVSMGGAVAQQQPTPAAVALATQILELKGGITMFDPAIDGVVLQSKANFLQINPNAGRALDEIERSMRADNQAALKQMHDEISRAYASQFSEQDLKDLLAFYKTPLGKKIIEQEPKAGEEATKRVTVWIEKYAANVGAKMRAELKKKGFSEF